MGTLPGSEDLKKVSWTTADSWTDPEPCRFVCRGQLCRQDRVGSVSSVTRDSPGHLRFASGASPDRPESRTESRVAMGSYFFFFFSYYFCSYYLGAGGSPENCPARALRADAPPGPYIYHSSQEWWCLPAAHGSTKRGACAVTSSPSMSDWPGSACHTTQHMPHYTPLGTRLDQVSGKSFQGSVGGAKGIPDLLAWHSLYWLLSGQI